MNTNTPLTDAAIADSFQTGLHQKVKAEEMRKLELRVAELEADIKEYEQDMLDMAWFDIHLSPEESERLFNEEVEVGKLWDRVRKERTGK
jgi:hypothetical protein